MNFFSDSGSLFSSGVRRARPVAVWPREGSGPPSSPTGCLAPDLTGGGSEIECFQETVACPDCVYVDRDDLDSGFFFSLQVCFVFQSCPTLQRLAAAHGLVALVGSESCLFQVRIRIKL